MAAGFKIIIVGACLATAFPIFAVQVQTIGSAVRRHVAEVSTGAVSVLQVVGQRTAVAAAVSQLDAHDGTPEATVTEVVLTRRRDPYALRGMCVDPTSFTTVAAGAGSSPTKTDGAASPHRISTGSAPPGTR